ncbi:hypothetical protein [Demequina litorisediminis]|uniref:hypothetical protein n=1 Tax=Demequina litorisediminis TaxID=1849022 RepID=UPI0024E0458D|nr:hypothetical protein [Demequina litorisediminis]
MLLVPTADAADAVAGLREQGIPVVLVDRGAADATVASVAVDDVVGGRLAAAHLLDGGRRRLAFVGGPRGIHQVADRFEGAAQAVEAVDGATLIRIETEALTLEEGMRIGAVVREPGTGRGGGRGLRGQRPAGDRRAAGAPVWCGAGEDSR